MAILLRPVAHSSSIPLPLLAGLSRPGEKPASISRRRCAAIYVPKRSRCIFFLGKLPRCAGYAHYRPRASFLAPHLRKLLRTRTRPPSVLLKELVCLFPMPRRRLRGSTRFARRFCGRVAAFMVLRAVGHIQGPHSFECRSGWSPRHAANFLSTSISSSTRIRHAYSFLAGAAAFMTGRDLKRVDRVPNRSRARTVVGRVS